jgi:hypothetical protein
MSMHHLRGARTLLAGAATAALLLGGALGASADPINPDTGAGELRALNGSGSDTTQDLNNGLASVVEHEGQLVLGSYDATIPAGDDNFIQSSDGGPEIPRPNGSSQGVAALRAAVTNTTLTNARGTSSGPLSTDDLIFSRSSSAATFVSGGTYSYIPLALDAVTFATHSNNTTIPGDLTQADLEAIYSAADGATVSLSAGSFTVGEGQQIVPFIPQAGSGTRSFWLSALGLTEDTVGSAVADEYDGNLVQEHDGSVLADVPNAMVPFSIAQYVAQGNSADLANDYAITVNNRINGAELGQVAGVNPIVGEELNTEFPIRRPVYTVVPFAELASNAALAAVFEGENGLAYTALNPVTQSSLVITDFGFGDLTGGVTIDDVTYNPGDTTSFRAN